MADLNDQDFVWLISTNINAFTKGQIQWHSGSNRGTNLMNTGPLVHISTFDVVPVAHSGDARAQHPLGKIVNEAYKCTAARRVVTGRNYTGWDSNNGYRDVAYGIAALHSGYRRHLTSYHDGTWKYGVGGMQDANYQGLVNHINNVKSELYSKIHSGTVDLRVCHSSCHDNCHNSRTRR